MTTATPADRIEANRIVAAIWADCVTRQGRPPSDTERARWARVYALAALGLDAVAGQPYPDGYDVEGVGVPAPAATPKAKRAKPKPRKPAKPAKPSKTKRPLVRRAIASTPQPVQLSLLDRGPAVSPVVRQGGPAMASPVVAPIVGAPVEPRTVYRGRRVIVEVRA